MPTGTSVGVFEAYGLWAAWYWFFVEFGTQRGVDAHPFIMPAYEAHRDDIVKGVAAALRSL